MKELPKELCVEVGEVKECMDGEILIAAILIECLFYFFAFVFGVKVVDYIRRKLRGEKGGGPRIR
tara:strand:- start:282 stop:476 length:195 start_codon:yes stop_codon:yes gene_type:complete